MNFIISHIIPMARYNLLIFFFLDSNSTCDFREYARHMNEDHACVTVLSFRSFNSFIFLSLWINIYFFYRLSWSVKPTIKTLRSLVLLSWYCLGARFRSHYRRHHYHSQHHIQNCTNQIQCFSFKIFSIGNFIRSHQNYPQWYVECWLINCHMCAGVFSKSKRSMHICFGLSLSVFLSADFGEKSSGAVNLSRYLFNFR